jgi:hypothetical protein
MVETRTDFHEAKASDKVEPHGSRDHIESLASSKLETVNNAELEPVVTKKTWLVVLVSNNYCLSFLY